MVLFNFSVLVWLLHQECWHCLFDALVEWFKATTIITLLSAGLKDSY
jgi:hypothetical protein